MKTRKFNIIVIFGVFLSGLVGPSCTDYLDVVPDNIPTIDHAFQNREEAMNFLYGLYAGLPNHQRPQDNPGFVGGDEAWLFDRFEGRFGEMAEIRRMWQGIAKGNQGTDAPVANYWGSEQDQHSLNGGKPLFTSIRDCNIFLEEIHKTVDLLDWEREIWVGEVKFLKAYYHFWLARMYGPIPIIDENVPMYSDPEMVQTYREPVDVVFNYIVELLDEASEVLPLEIEDFGTQLGRITKPAALALKGQVLTYAASPFFNGNTDYAGFVDNRGINLFPQTYDHEKWGKAAEALKEAIEVSHEAGHELYDFTMSGVTGTLNEKTILAMGVRGAVTERWNNEKIWADTKRGPTLQRFSYPAFNLFTAYNLWQAWAPTLRVVEQFYTENGVPIDEDIDWVGMDLYELREGDEEHKFYIREGFNTINLHFNREARFYGSISFDGGLYFGIGSIHDTDLRTARYKYAAIGIFNDNAHSTTGYLVKKFVHRLTACTMTSNIVTFHYTDFPLIRLADIYLMYAEALNEYQGPDSEVYEYIDRVRDRSGLNGVVESWVNHSIQPAKPLTKEGMRDIIRRERMNELAFEGPRFWDLRRWKLTEEYMNRPIRGLSIYETTNDFYNVQELYTHSFEKREYLWPIMIKDLLKNRNLVQNPGW